MQQYYAGKHPLVDVWAMACVFCELANPKEGRSLFWAPSSLKQIVRIFEQLGKPTEDDWPGITTHPFFTEPANRVELDLVVAEHKDMIHLFDEVKGAAADVVKLHDILMTMLELDPRRRAEAEDIMNFFVVI
jgi:serine/threonine protein kinase